MSLFSYVPFSRRKKGALNQAPGAQSRVEEEEMKTKGRRLQSEDVKRSREDKDFVVDEAWLLETFKGVVKGSNASTVLKQLQSIDAELQVGGLVAIGLAEAEEHAMEKVGVPFVVRVEIKRFAKERTTVAALTTNSRLSQIEVIKVTFEQLSDLPFTLNRIWEDDESHREVLGPLYKQDSKWPVIVASETQEKTIDMRLLSRKVFDPEGDELRPAARAISSRLLLGEGTIALVAVPGVGKSSALIDVGREHYVIYIQSSTPSDLSYRGPMTRRSREFDRNFVAMVEDVRMRTLDDANTTSMTQNWNVALHRTMVELVARVLQLVRLYRDLGAKLTPWVFTVHQIAGSQNFVTRVVKLLRTADAGTLEDILAAAMLELRPIFSAQRRFAVAIDEMELAAHELRERFIRPMSQGENKDGLATGDTKKGEPKPKGILSPLVRAVSDLSPIANWSLVLAGTGASEESVTRLTSDLGKLKTSTVINDAPAFPLTQSSDVISLLRRLEVSEELKELLAEGLEASPLHRPARDLLAASDLKTSATWVKFLLEDYIFPARFRMLCAVVEYIKRNLDSDSADEILLGAIRMSVRQHKDGLQNLIRVRLNPDHPYSLKDGHLINQYLDYLLQVTVAVRLTDGSTPILVPPSITNSSITDLTRLGIAASSETSRITDPLDPSAISNASTYSAFRVCERFVVEVLVTFFEDAEVLKRAQAGKARELLHMLQNTLSSFGANISFKGTIVEKIVLERLVALAREHTKVTELPFFPRASADATWEEWEFAPSRLELYAPERSTPGFLSSQAASDVVYAPEPVCRPDGIVMLRHRSQGGATLSERRAISLGVAVYTDGVPRDKVESQFWSTDLSRAFLNKDHKTYAATLARREKWVEQGLHETVALRVHILLPHAAAAPSFATQRYQRESVVSPSTAPQPLRKESSPAVQEDLIVNIDRSNLQLMLGEPNGDVAKLYRLIDVATGAEKSFSN